MKPMIPKRTRRLRARAATMNHHESEFEDYGPEPNMKLSHAFLVVLLLHVIAVGGIYAFNSFKASKAPKLTESARSLSPQDQPALPPLGQGGDDQNSGDSRNQPPSDENPPLVAKTSEATSTTDKTTARTIGEDAPKPSPRVHQGLISAIRAALHKLTAPAGAAAVTASAAAQDAPTPAPVAVSQPSVETPSVPSAPVQTPKTYLVKAGDTLTRISASLGVGIPELEKANNMTSTSILRIGETLQVPDKTANPTTPDLAGQTNQDGGGAIQAPPTVSGAVSPVVQGAVIPSVPSGDTKEYTVVKGDNPYKIAKKFKITPAELMKVNNITDPKKIQIGQKLKIPPSRKQSKSGA